MKIFGMIFCFLISTPSFSQVKLEWEKDYKLTLENFKSPTTEIKEGVNSRMYYSGANMDFLFQMSNIEFMLTKNFNEKVTGFFNQSAATIIAPDTTIARQLLAVANYDFDLTELYCRKFRKELYDNKGAFSNASFFKPIFEQVQSEMTQRVSDVMQRSDLGAKHELLKEEHGKVVLELELLANYCKTCKPPKKMKKKKK